MAQYIDKSALIEEIERRKQVAYGWMETAPNDAIEAESELCDDILSFLDTLEIKEANNIWYDARKTLPEDSTEQIICIKEDGLAVITVGRIVNGTVKWVYLNNLLKLSPNIEVKEADFDAEWKRYFEHRGDVATVNVKHLAKHFFELGLKAQKGE